jgi:hypothetical protein
MKRVALTLLAILVVVAFATGQQTNISRYTEPRHTEGFTPMPNELNYQGVLTTGSGFPADGIYSLQFDLFYVAVGGGSLWTETHGAVTVQNGTFSVRLGTLTPLPYFVTPYYLQVTANSGPGIGAPFAFSPRNQLASAPYALGPWHQYGFALAAPYYWVGIGTDTPYTTLTLNGSLGFTNSSTPEVYIYQSGTGNSSRMVLSHSPSFPQYGLEYNDNLDYMTFTGGFGDALTVDLDGRRVGIGTAAAAPSGFAALHSATSYRYGGYFTTDSLSSQARSVFGQYLGTGNFDAVGVYGRSTPADYYGYGGYFTGGWRGVYGSVNATGGNFYTGVYGSVTGGTGWNYGVYGAASGGANRFGVYGFAAVMDNSYAGYMEGRLRVAAATGDSSVMLPSDAISSQEILDEPGIAEVGSTGTVFLSSASVMTDIDTVDITVPGPGYVVVEARSTAFFRDVTGHNQLFVQIDTVAGGGLVSPYFVRAGLYAYASAADYSYFPVYATRTYVVTGPGTHTYRFLGLEATANVASNTCGVFASQLRATYYPTSYGTVEASINPAAVTSPQANAESQMTDLRTLEMRMARARIAAQEAELQLLKARREQEQAKDQQSSEDR